MHYDNIKQKNKYFDLWWRGQCTQPEAECRESLKGLNFVIVRQTPSQPTQNASQLEEVHWDDFNQSLLVYIYIYTYMTDTSEIMWRRTVMDSDGPSPRAQFQSQLIRVLGRTYISPGKAILSLDECLTSDPLFIRFWIPIPFNTFH